MLAIARPGRPRDRQNRSGLTSSIVGFAAGKSLARSADRLPERKLEMACRGLQLLPEAQILHFTLSDHKR